MGGNAGTTLPANLVGVRFRKIREQHPAFLGAVTAGFRAAPAVLVSVLRAFLSAGLADLGADFPDHIHHLAVARHVGSRQAADLGAIHIQPDAARQFTRVRFGKAGHRAPVADIGALIARIDTGSVLLIDHGHRDISY
jgi:hypothetical protein